MNNIIKYVRNRAPKQDDQTPYANLENTSSVISSSLNESQNDTNQSANQGRKF